MSLISKCLLPSAITPAQKIFCATAGFASFGIGTGLTYKYVEKKHKEENLFDRTERVLENSKDKFYNFINRRKKNKLNRESNNEKPFTDLTNATISGGLGILCGFGALSNTLAVFYNSTVFYKEIQGTNKCCNIIRSALIVSIKNTISGSLGVATGMASYHFFRVSKEFVQDHLNSKKN